MNMGKKKKFSLTCKKKGIILLEKISDKFHFEYLKNIFLKFGKISKIFFISDKILTENSNFFSKIYRNIGWVEFLDKVDAKSASSVLSHPNFFLSTIYGRVKIRYLKNFRWDNLSNFIKKKTKKKIFKTTEYV